MPERQLDIPVASASIVGDLVVPDDARGVVVFAHGSGSSRHSPRNRLVASGLQHHGLATLLLDLLTPAEGAVDDRTAELRFDIDLLAERLELGLDAVVRDEPTGSLPIGVFGASTGAAAALIAAARRPASVLAVVSRGGRPDLASPYLDDVVVPTLLIVGGLDVRVLDLNRQTAARLRGEHELAVVPGASHLFPEPGALDEVTRLAARWFVTHLTPMSTRSMPS